MSLDQYFADDMTVKQLKTAIGKETALLRDRKVLIELLKRKQSESRKKSRLVAEETKHAKQAVTWWKSGPDVLLLISAFLKFPKVAALCRVDKATQQILSCRVTRNPSAYLRSMQVLKLRENGTTDKCPSTIRKVIMRMPSLTKLHLDLSTTSFGLLQEIGKSGRKLQSLKLHARDDSLELSELYPLLRGLQHLRSLTVVGVYAIDTFPDAVLTKVEELTIELQNQFYLHQNNTIFHALAAFPSLRRLCISTPNLVSDYFETFAVCPNLTILDLYHAQFSYNVDLWKSLESCNQLVELHLPSRATKRFDKTYISPKMKWLYSSEPLYTRTLNTFPNLEVYSYTPRICELPQLIGLKLPHLRRINYHFCCLRKMGELVWQLNKLEQVELVKARHGPQKDQLTPERLRLLESLPDLSSLKQIDISAINEQLLGQVQHKLRDSSFNLTFSVSRALFGQCEHFQML